MFFCCFPNFAKNAAPHENTANSSENVDRVAAKSSNIRQKNGSKNQWKTASHFWCVLEGFGDDFGKLLGAFWRPKTVPNSSRILGCSFVGMRNAAWPRRGRGGPGAGKPPWAAPLSCAEGSYKRLGSQAPLPKHRKHRSITSSTNEI